MAGLCGKGFEFAKFELKGCWGDRRRTRTDGRTDMEKGCRVFLLGGLGGCRVYACGVVADGLEI